jgi:hypothetical protein
LTLQLNSVGPSKKQNQTVLFEFNNFVYFCKSLMSTLGGQSPILAR